MNNDSTRPRTAKLRRAGATSNAQEFVLIHHPDAVVVAERNPKCSLRSGRARPERYVIATGDGTVISEKYWGSVEHWEWAATREETAWQRAKTLILADLDIAETKAELQRMHLHRGGTIEQRVEWHMEHDYLHSLLDRQETARPATRFDYKHSNLAPIGGQR